MSTQNEQVIDNWQDQVTEPLPSKQPPPPPEKEKQPTPIQPQTKQPKQTLKEKIDQYRNLTLQQFNAKYSENVIDYKKQLKLGTTKILKSDKDFHLFAQQIAQKICQHIGPDDTLDDQSIFIFIGLNWQNLFEISKKLKILKNQRKTDEKKIKKQKIKKGKQKPDEQQSKTVEKQKQSIQQDDLFSGVATMTSKEEEELRKKKIQKKLQQQQPPTKPKPSPHDENDDDDDFM